MSHIKHIDIKYKYVDKYLEDGIFKVMFVKSAGNYSNVFTKNVSSELQKKHLKKMIGKNPNNYQDLERFKDKMKGDKYDVSSSNI